MANLNEIQEKLFNALTQSTIDLNELTILSACPPLTASQRLMIYRNSITTALITSLQENYAVCNKLVGEDFFKALAQIYVQQYPSYSPNICDYGASLPQFIRDFPHTQSLLYLADVADLEWAWHRAFFAANEQEFPLEKLEKVSVDLQGTLLFELPSASTLLVSNYPIHLIWQANQQNYTDDYAIDLDQGGVKLLVWRRAMEVRIDVLDDEEWLFLDAVAKKKNLQQLYNYFVADKKQPAVNVITLLPALIKRGWISNFSLQG